ncbi:MraY family glycosyltransferase [Selenihalanaerobacter shriftii]|uniref:UDP-N-acetylmuramyl pentapeptide phosphotransferase/UDP-N-acetylglucosamine-1-phosphate transferase n=1 Tax=Selenihalanaerobacter shriftii TaxID=142842 RepID=A0A1T4P184_9FIRM|nr:hypothetical protein [Selenihalanaerobacter shriftii]SJZ85209.1 hypothetical protein SAMN02745118_01996 [Selenihalanaerobacter shriftii]
MLFLFSLALMLTYIGYPLTKHFLVRYHLVIENYSGNQLPVGYGILLVINAIIILAIGQTINIYPRQLSLSFLFLISVVALVGLLDDYFGDGTNRGFSGHLGKLFYDFEITTGLLKVILIGVAAFLIVNRLNSDLFLLGVNFLVIVLMTNFINLLDLRPGRALKGFIIIILITGLFFNKLIMPLLAMTLILLPIDLREEAMLGDVGSNFLGSFLGLSLVFSLESIYKLILISFLLLIHLYTEKYSLTEFISQNKLLNYLDELGRSKP